MNMADVGERKKIARALEKMSESIHALKINRIEESIGHFKFLIELLRLFIDSPGMRATKRVA